MSESTAQMDREKGLKAIEYFFDAARFFKIDYNFSQLVQIIDGRGRGSISGIGLGAYVTDMSDFQLRSAMSKLAALGSGKIPSSNSAFTKALSDTMTSISFMDGVNIVVDSAGDLVNVGQSIGKATMNTLNMYNFVAENKKYFIAGAVVIGASFYGKKLMGLAKMIKR